MSVTPRRNPSHPWRGKHREPQPDIPAEIPCRICGRTQGPEAYRWRADGYPGRVCRTCHNARTLAHYRRDRAERPDAYRERDRRQYRRRRARATRTGHAHWWSTTRAAAELGISPVQAWRLCRAGRLATTRVGTHYRIDPASVRKYADERYT